MMRPAMLLCAIAALAGCEKAQDPHPVKQSGYWVMEFDENDNLVSRPARTVHKKVPTGPLNHTRIWIPMREAPLGKPGVWVISKPGPND